MSSDFHFYEKALDVLDSALSAYIDATVANVIGAISGAAYTLLFIYVMLWGWSTLRGMISEPVTDGVTRVVRLALITSLAINVGVYNGFLANLLWQMPDAFAQAVVTGFSNQSEPQYLDGLMSKLYDLGDAYWQVANAQGGLVPNLGLIAVALCVWIIGLATTAYGAFLLALAKIALAIILGIGPVFVLMLMFDATKRFFDAWIAQVLNYVFLVALTAAAIKLVMTVLDQYLSDAIAAGVLADPSISQALPALALSAISCLILMQLPSIASSLAGGVAISTLSAAGWAYGKATGGALALRPTALRRSANRLRSDVRITKEVARALAQAPSSVYRKVTGGTRNRISKA